MSKPPRQGPGDTPLAQRNAAQATALLFSALSHMTHAKIWGDPHHLWCWGRCGSGRQPREGLWVTGGGRGGRGVRGWGAAPGRRPEGGEPGVRVWESRGPVGPRGRLASWAESGALPGQTQAQARLPGLGARGAAPNTGLEASWRSQGREGSHRRHITSRQQRGSVPAGTSQNQPLYGQGSRCAPSYPGTVPPA